MNRFENLETCFDALACVLAAFRCLEGLAALRRDARQEAPSTDAPVGVAAQHSTEGPVVRARARAAVPAEEAAGVAGAHGAAPVLSGGAAAVQAPTILREDTPFEWRRGVWTTLFPVLET